MGENPQPLEQKRSSCETALAGASHLLRGVLVGTLILGTICAAPAFAASPNQTINQQATHEAEVHRTAGGIPHVFAHDFASIGFGSGYAMAEDLICTLADQFLTFAAERSLFLEPTDANIASDFFYQLLIDRGEAEELSRKWPDPAGTKVTEKQAIEWWQSTATRLRAVLDEAAARAQPRLVLPVDLIPCGARGQPMNGKACTASRSRCFTFGRTAKARRRFLFRPAANDPRHTARRARARRCHPIPEADPMKGLENIEEIFHVAFGYMASKALFAALHLGVFDALAEGPKQLPALVEATGTEERGLTTLLTALTAVGLIEKGEAGWVNSPAAAENLVSGAPGDFGDYLRYQIDRQMYPFMHNLTDVLKGRRDTVPFESYEAWFRDASEATLYSESQHAASMAPAMMLSALVDLSQRRRLLDVGGGSGAFAITLCGLHAQLSATILDFPNVVEVARKRVAAAGLESRIELVAGNALTCDWPGGQDAVLFSYISGSVSAEGVGELYRRAFAALEPGGSALIHDFMVDDDRTGPPLAAIWALQHATFTPGAVSLTPGFVTGLLREIGFEEVSLSPFIPGMTRLVQAHKPG